MTTRINIVNRQRDMAHVRRWGLLALALAVVLSALFTFTGSAEARGAPESFADLVEKYSPAVVNISTVQNIPARRGRRLPDLPEGTPFGDLWEEFREQFDEGDEPREARSLGSGFIIDADGYVVTNYHVIEEADEITVITIDGDEYEADIVGRDRSSDLALLKIEADEPLPNVGWGNSDGDRIGDWVMTIGNPYGLGGTVTAGIISARNRQIGNSNVEFIQTDAPINRGNSGGPMFNMEGEVIGVNTLIFSPSGGNVGIGFAIPSNYAGYIIDQIREFGRVRRGWLGVSIQAMTKEYAESLGLETDEGALVSRVFPDSPAAAAGVQPGDVITEWDGKPIKDSAMLSRLVGRTEMDRDVDMILIRAGERVTLSVRTGERDDSDFEDDEDSAGRKGDEENPFGDRALVQGMELSPITADLRRRYRIDEDVDGVVATRVVRRSPAARNGIRPGTVIIRVNQRPVSEPVEVVQLLDEALEDGRENALLLVHFRGNTVHILLPLVSDGDADETGDGKR